MINKCYICNVEEKVESVSNRGYVMKCEIEGCVNSVCKECLAENDSYKQMLERSRGKFTAIAVIECIECLNSDENLVRQANLGNFFGYAWQTS